MFGLLSSGTSIIPGSRGVGVRVRVGYTRNLARTLLDLNDVGSPYAQFKALRRVCLPQTLLLPADVNGARSCRIEVGWGELLDTGEA